MNKTLKQGLLLVLAAWSCQQAQAQVQAQAGGSDLLSIYAQARAADPLLASAQAQRGIQQESTEQARAAMLPQWRLQVEQNHAETSGLPGHVESRLLGSRLSQSLVDVAQWRTLQAENERLSADEARLRAAEQELCARVARAYFGVLLARAGVSTTQANERAFADQVQQAQARFAAGLSAQVDVDQARSFHQLVRGQLVQAQQDFADAQQALAQIIGQEPGALATLASELPALPPQPQEPQAWVERALSSNPTLKASAAELSASERRIEAARASHLPKLSLGLDSDRQSGSGVTPNLSGRTVNTLGVQLTIPLFAGGATASQVRQASYRRDAIQSEQESAKRALIRETQAKFQAVLSTLAQMETGRMAVQAADQALASTRAGQALGTRSMTDLLLAIQTQASAQNAYEQARHRHVLAKLLLSQAAGALDETELAAANQWLRPDKPKQDPTDTQQAPGASS
ncbi:TolC family outer membrane protein [Paucibacter sp. Y2R2-4]|uniref:TolC family outer membrane protein n=1 Tax=Paucibacter sp. Y2R2-4 TaxID=2893553 RepID=UPI0021E3631C|nr:TolC family outer membrane protein [Paucibacter sp. Y2R2-4]MCV2352456.1 TolC family outer membrane protein [Paucibacter sp. Y2R2-4]